MGTTEGASPIVGDDEAGVCFDSEGCLTYNKQRKPVYRHQFMRDSVIAVLLNLDAKSPNFNTLSLFFNGGRISAPQALPDTLKGKPLFPTVTWRNLTVHANFGPTALCPLPFKCRMVQDASASDCKIKAYPIPKDGRYSLIVP